MPAGHRQNRVPGHGHLTPASAGQGPLFALCECGAHSPRQLAWRRRAEWHREHRVTVRMQQMEREEQR